MNIIEAKNPKYITSDKSIIQLDVLFEGYSEYLPFGATANDVETHGRELYTRAVSGEFGEIASGIPEVSLEEAKAEKLKEINTACDSILNAAISTYPETEVLTFDQQTSEANAYLASKNPADAPLLTALAAGRGITLDDLVQRVIAKHDAFSLLSGYVIGQRQALEDRLELCETVGEVQAIDVNITLPEAGNAETA